MKHDILRASRCPLRSGCKPRNDHIGWLDVCLCVMVRREVRVCRAQRLGDVLDGSGMVSWTGQSASSIVLAIMLPPAVIFECQIDQ